MKKRLYLIPIIACLTVGLYLFWSVNKKNETVYINNSPEYIRTNLPPIFKTGTNFTLTNHNNEKFEFSSVSGKPSLLYFGYTHCPDFCPTSLQIFDVVAQKVGFDKINRIFVTVDPERDTVEALKSYVSLFKEGLIGLTGTLEEVDKVAKSWRIFYSYQKNKDDDKDYVVDHITYMYLTNREGHLIAMIQSDTPPEDIIKFIQDNKL